MERTVMMRRETQSHRNCWGVGRGFSTDLRGANMYISMQLGELVGIPGRSPRYK